MFELPALEVAETIGFLVDMLNLKFPLTLMVLKPLEVGNDVAELRVIDIEVLLCLFSDKAVGVPHAQQSCIQLKYLLQPFIEFNEQSKCPNLFVEKPKIFLFVPFE